MHIRNLFAPLRPLNNAIVRARYIRNRSRCIPHQGKRECLRRRINGFSGIANMAADLGTTREVQERRIDEFHSAIA